MKSLVWRALTLGIGLSGCGHYYHGYYPGAVGLGAPTVVVGEAESDGAIVLGTVVTGTASGSWTAQNGWSGAGVVLPGVPLAVDTSCSVPRLAAAAPVNGNGAGLAGLVGPGIHVSCGACSTREVVTTDGVGGGVVRVVGGTGHDDSVAALSLLGSLSSLSLGGDSLVASSDGVRLEAALAHDALGAGGGESAIVVRALGGPPGRAPTPVRVHLVIDTSTSMARRWDEVREAALALVGRLRPEDELVIVAYATDARIALAPALVGDGAAARAAILGLSCEGRTNIEAGLRAAYATLAPSGGSIVLLLSDGVPEGGFATPRELGALAAEARVRTGATTVTIGLGSEFHAGILGAIARRGGGDFRIAPTAHELGALLEAELELHTNVVARDIAFELQLAPGVGLAAGIDLQALDAGVEVRGTRVTIRMGTIAASETRTLVLPIQLAAPGAVVSCTARATVAGGPFEGGRALAVRSAPLPIPAGGLAASLDADLSSALVAAAGAVENGDAGAAARALRAHADVASQLASGDPAIEARRDHVLAFAAGLEASVPAASWGARRQAAQAMLEWSAGLGR